MRTNNDSGLLSLEACISLFLFLFFMLFIYSFFVFFEARNEVSHVLLATASSMSYDKHEHSKADIIEDFKQDYSQLETMIFDLEKDPNANGFTNDELWEDESGKTDEQFSKDVSEAAKKRFVAYLADGDEQEANRRLISFHIVDGLDGMDFSKSSIIGSDLHIEVNYRIGFEFNFFRKEGVPITQSCQSRIWK